MNDQPYMPMAVNHDQVETTIPRRVKELVGQHGGLRPAARVLKMTPQYLYRLGNGEKKNASAKVLRKLGLIRYVTYWTISAPPHAELVRRVDTGAEKP